MFHNIIWLLADFLEEGPQRQADEIACHKVKSKVVECSRSFSITNVGDITPKLCLSHNYVFESAIGAWRRYMYFMFIHMDV